LTLKVLIMAGQVMIDQVRRQVHLKAVFVEFFLCLAI